LIRSRSYKTVVLFLLIGCTLSAWGQSREKDYVRQDSARFRVWYCPEDAQVVRGLWQTIRDRIPVVERQLGLALADTVAFVVTPTEKEWFRLTAGAPLWTNGLAIADRGIAILKSPRFGLPYGPLPVTAIHEYVHLLLEAGAPRAAYPRWFNEGLAQVLAGQLDYMDNHLLARAGAAGRIHGLNQIEGLMSMSAPEAQQAYAESAVAVQLLQSRYGMTGMSNLVHEVRAGRRFEDSFSMIFGAPVGSFETEYLAYIQRTYRISLIGDTELWISAIFVILVLAAGMAVWFRRRKTIKRWSEEDGRASPVSGEVSPPPYTVNYTLIRGRLHEKTEDDSTEDNPPFDRPMPGN